MTDGTSDPVGPAAPSAPAGRPIPDHVLTVARYAAAALGLTDVSERHAAVLLGVLNDEDNGGRPGDPDACPTPPGPKRCGHRHRPLIPVTPGGERAWKCPGCGCIICVGPSCPLRGSQR